MWDKAFNYLKFQGTSKGKTITSESRIVVSHATPKFALSDEAINVEE